MKTSEYETLNLLEKEWKDDNLSDLNENNKYRGLSSYTLNFKEALEVVPHKYHKFDSLSIDLSKEDLRKYNSLILSVKGDGLLRISIDALNFLVSNHHIIEYSLVPFEDCIIFKLDYEGYEKFRESIQCIKLIFGFDVNEKEFNLDQNPSIHAKLDKSIITRFELTTEKFAESEVINTKAKVLLKEIADKYLDRIDIANSFNLIEKEAYDLSYENDVLNISTTTSKGQWSYVFTSVKGYFKIYRKIVAVIYGDKGTKIKFKLSGPSIKTIETGNTRNNNIEDPICAGTVQKIEWYINEDNLTDDEMMNFYVFVEPGLIGSNKRVQFYELYFSK